MKILMRSLLACVALSLVTVACDDGSAKAAADKAAAETAEAAKKAKAESEAAAQKAADAARKAAEETKAVISGAVTSLTKEVDDVGTKATELKAKAAKLAGAKKKTAEAAGEELDKRMAAAKAAIAKVGSATKDDWESLKQSAENELKGLAGALENYEKAVDG